MRFQTLKRHGLLVIVIFVLPHVIAASCAGLAPVVKVGHFECICLATAVYINPGEHISVETKLLQAADGALSSLKKKIQPVISSNDACFLCANVEITGWNSWMFLPAFSLLSLGI